MNDYEFLRKRPRNQTLLLVEGEKTENEILTLISKSAPFDFIDMNNVWVFHSNIYNLFSLIEKEYPNVWDEESVEINIPLLISRREKLDKILDKRDFTNIILAFDFERQDSQFSEEKICLMQKRFCNMTGEGILYLSYPMAEAFFDMKKIPENDYYKKVFRSDYKKGKEYKTFVFDYSYVSKYFDFYEKLERRFRKKHYEMEMILSSRLNDLGEVVGNENNGRGENHNLVCSLNALLDNYDMDFSKISFYEQVWNMIYYISFQNIRKSWWLQTGDLIDDKEHLHNIYADINLYEILKKQINVSRSDEMGIIYVLCTPVMLLGEYKFFWEQVKE